MQTIQTVRGPIVQIHHVERHVHGNGIGIKVFAEIKIAAKQMVYAGEVKLNTIKTMVLTPLTGSHEQFTVQKYIHNKGEYGNYASIDVFSATANQLPYGRYASEDAATSLPEDGSIWLDAIIQGE